MNVLVVTSQAPFSSDDSDDVCGRLVRHLLLLGNKAEAIRLPFRPRSVDGLIDELVFTRSLRLENVDLLIGLGFPAYVAPHRNKVLWLQDQHGPLRADLDARGRDAAWHADNLAFSEARHIYSTSRRVARALRRSHGFEARVVPVPRDDADWENTIGELLA